MKIVTLIAAALCTLAAPAFAQPAMPTQSTDPARCQWAWKSGPIAGGSLGVWAERCELATGVWELDFRDDLSGFVLTVDGKDNGVVLQVFAKPAEADITAILPELRRRGYIPDDGDCVFEPAAGDVPPAPRTQAFFEIMPAGARKAAFDATPPDEVPEPPCGDYGWSTHGIRYFVTDLAHPERVVYVNIGQDGMMFDERTVTLE